MRHVLSDADLVTSRDITLELEGTMTTIPVMRRDCYDTDDDGVVDKASGIPVLDEIPTDLSEYNDGDMFKVGTRTYIVDKSA